MLRVLIVVPLLAVAAFLVAWIMPEGLPKQMVQIFGAIVLMIGIFLCPLVLLQWLSAKNTDPSP